MDAQIAAAVIVLSCFCPRGASPENALTISTDVPRFVRVLDSGTVQFASGTGMATLRSGDRFGTWTLVGTAGPTSSPAKAYAVLEDFSRWDGHIVFVDRNGVQADLPKSADPTFDDASRLYLGHTFEEVRKSPADLLANEILEKSGDPDYGEVAAIFPPIREMKTETFVGTHDSIDKIGFEYGGVSPDFDPAAYDPEILKVRAQGMVWAGLVGGWLPVMRWIYPQDAHNWTELIAFAPMRVEDGNPSIQPVWYRVCRIEGGSLKWMRYFDSYLAYPPRTHADASKFYRDLGDIRTAWQQILEPAMSIHIPDERLSNMVRLSLVRDMMTRVGDYPKYGVFDKNYGGSEHEGFPDTFNVDTTAMLDWGLLDLAGRYIDNYLSKYVRDDGSILYRGPEMGQYGRMLTIIAQYVDYGGNPKLLLRDRRRINGITNLLLSFRAKALKLPKTDPAYGMIAGWSEADSCLDPDPARYLQPYFSNSTEAARGFGDLGRAWQKVGRNENRPELVSWGRKLVNESDQLAKDIQAAIKRSILIVDHERVLPSIAGAKEPFHRAVTRDPLDPQYRSYRAYMEMLYSGILSGDEARMIIDYRARHHDTILGIPTAYGYNTGELAGFLSYGHAYGLIQQDMVRESVLMLYGMMAHQYTRGTWTAPETRSIIPGKVITPYCTPAQLFVAMVTRWLLVFEDPQSNTLWLARATPRSWLEDGKTISVERSPTRWGRIGYRISSKISAGAIVASVRFPPVPFKATTHLRLRAPEGHRITFVTVDGASWERFNASDEIVTIPPGRSGIVTIVAKYEEDNKPLVKREAGR